MTDLNAAELATPPAKPDRYALLLAQIQAEGGLWTGTRAAVAIYRNEGRQVTNGRGEQCLKRLAERGELVLANPPRGRTYRLPGSPSANEVLGRLNRALAELGMPTAALTLASGTSTYDMTIGLPIAVLRLVHADDPDQSYGEIRIQFPFKATTEGER